MPCSRLAVRLAAVALTAGAATACAGTHAVRQDVAGSAGYVTGNGTIRVLGSGSRPAVHDVTGTLLDGAHFDLSAWRGKVVVVNFWESDCAPCRSEADALDQVARDSRANGVEFLGVDIRDDASRARAFVAAHHVPYPSLYDDSGSVALQFRGLPPNATPTTLIVDRKGRVAARASGAILYTDLRSLVDRIAAEPA